MTANNFFRSPLNLSRLLMLVALSLLLAIQPAAAQFGSDGTTLNDFVLDNQGFAWFKAKPYGLITLRPNPQLRFIADPGNDRGGNALHPDSHYVVEEIIKDVVKTTGSTATWEISWETSPGLAGGYQLKIQSDRGSRSISCAQIAIDRMKKGRQATTQALVVTLSPIL